VPHLDQLLAAYGLRAYPFGLNELNPIERADDYRLIAPVGGWSELDEVSTFLEPRRNDGTVIVVAGGSGTGRTSMCNFIIDKWREILGSRQNRPVIVQHSVQNSDAAEQVWSWSHRVRRAVTAAGFRLENPATQELQQLRTKKPDAVGASVGEALELVREQLAEQNALIVGVLEGVKNEEFLSICREVAEFSGILLLLTVDETPSTNESVLERAHTLGGQGKLLKLEALSGHEAAEVVVRRWSFYSESESESRCPFSEQGLVAAFAHPPRPLKRVLKLVDAILQNRFLNSDDRAARLEARPGPISDESLSSIVRVLDRLQRD
jgi:hypothetical protein